MSINVLNGVSGILTVGVGGLVAYTKKTISTYLKDAEQVRAQANADIAQIMADVSKVSADVQALAASVTKPVAKKAAPRRVAGK